MQVEITVTADEKGIRVESGGMVTSALSRFHAECIISALILEPMFDQLERDGVRTTWYREAS